MLYYYIMTKLSTGWLLFIIVALGISVRLLNILSHPLPINDGGLFYTMSQDLIANHYRLPTYTSYNQDLIPFAYPPLGFYIIALLHQLTHIDLIQLFRWLPCIYSSVSILCFYYFVKKLTHSIYFSLLASLFFSLNISLYQWLIMGGGMTRSLGLIFALLTLSFATQISIPSFNRKYLLITSFFLGLTALSHTEQTLIAIISLPFVIKFSSTWRNTLIVSFTIYLLGFLISLPWLATVIYHHSFTPYLAAISTGGNLQHLIISAFNLNLGFEKVLPLFTVIGLSGLFLSSIKKIIFFLFGLLSSSINAMDSNSPIWFSVSVVAFSSSGSILNSPIFQPINTINPLNSSISVNWISSCLSPPQQQRTVHHRTHYSHGID